MEGMTNTVIGDPCEGDICKGDLYEADCQSSLAASPATRILASDADHHHVKLYR